MHLGIIAATAAEARILTKAPIRAGELTFLPEGGIIILSGIGARRAGLAARTLLENGATALVSWGLAGGLLPAVASGSLILPQCVIGPNQSMYRVAPLWHERLCNRLERHVVLHRGTLAESMVVLSDGAGKASLFQRTGAMAVDMESASIALAAQKAEVPFMAIRAIMDEAEMVIPRSVLNSVDEFGHMHSLRLVSYLIGRPAEVGSLIKLVRNFQSARATLTVVARQAGSNLLCPGDEKLIEKGRET